MTSKRRDFFAAAALQALLAHPVGRDPMGHIDDVVTIAWGIADKMLEHDVFKEAAEELEKAGLIKIKDGMVSLTEKGKASRRSGEDEDLV
jgi:non-canonical (house-cleaning) NTP pyrophosphatase